MAEPIDRVRHLVAAARRIADPGDPLGIEARSRLVASTGLSLPNVERALTECLETNPSDTDLSALCRSVPSAPRAHVLLSASVFVAAHRAIALALACSEHPTVRSSRREPEMARLLARAAPGLFELTSDLDPESGDHVFAYGSDEALRAVARGFREGVVVHPHGSGIGAVVLELTSNVGAAELASVARDVAHDVVLFDQRGCLSPRVVLVSGRPEAARAFAQSLSHALGEWERTVPLGAIHEDERADIRRHRDTWLVAGEVFTAGSGSVSLDPRDPAREMDASENALVVPPVGRNVHVRCVRDLAPLAPALAPLLTSAAAWGGRSFREQVAAAFPRARLSRPGSMQSPPLDGPVDLRALRNAASPGP